MDEIADDFLHSPEFKKSEQGGIATVRYPTAELQSIIRWIVSVKQEEVCDRLELTISLLPSDTDDSYATAYMAHLTLQKLWKRGLLSKVKDMPKCNIERVAIKVADETEFNQSIDALFNKYDEERENVDSDCQVIINATGGYKAICAYSTIYAQIHDLPCIYTFESTDCTAVKLLPLPISYALNTLDDEMALLNGIVKNSRTFSYEKLKSLPGWLRGLFTEKKGKLEPLALANTLLKYYEKNRHISAAKGSGMLDNLNGEYRKYIENRINREWAELWLGDQIPETVEHSRRHSKRLMELAGNMYRSLDTDIKESLGMNKPSFVALLIAAIYLHDIGHTVAAYPIGEQAREKNRGVFPLGLFPSCVREVHHLLSTDLITLHKDALFFIGKEKVEKNVDIRIFSELVPLICAYHRGYTKLKKDKANPSERIQSVGRLLYGEAFEKTLEPLEERLEEKKEQLLKWGITVEDVLRITALLRVIDGCDVQADRTVSPEYMKARLERTKEEAESIWWQLKGTLPQEEYKDALGYINAIQKVSQKITLAQAMEGTIENKECLEDNCNDIYDFVLKKLNAIKDRTKALRISEDNLKEVTLLSLINGYAFKWEQFLHFHKHRSVAFVLPMQTEKGVEIGVWPGGQGGDIQDIITDIGKERDATEGLLEKLIITVVGK